MHDLNTINRLNTEAFAAAVGKYRKEGKFVLAEYAGATLMSIETFALARDAFARFDQFKNRNDSTSAKLFFPLATDTALVLPPIESTLLDAPLETSEAEARSVPAAAYFSGNATPN